MNLSILVQAYLSILKLNFQLLLPTVLSVPLVDNLLRPLFSILKASGYTNTDMRVFALVQYVIFWVTRKKLDLKFQVNIFFSGFLSNWEKK